MLIQSLLSLDLIEPEQLDRWRVEYANGRRPLEGVLLRHGAITREALAKAEQERHALRLIEAPANDGSMVMQVQADDIHEDVAEIDPQEMERYRADAAQREARIAQMMAISDVDTTGLMGDPPRVRRVVQDVFRVLMRSQNTQPAMLAASVGLWLVVMLGIGWTAAKPTNPSPGLPLQYYYDLNTGQRLVMPAQGPSVELPSGPARGDRAGRPAGVVAQVFSCGSCGDESREFVGWLESYAPPNRAMPLAARLMLAEPTLQLRRPHDTAWLPVRSAEAGHLMRAVYDRCPEGTIRRCEPAGSRPFPIDTSLLPARGAAPPPPAVPPGFPTPRPVTEPEPLDPTPFEPALGEPATDDSAPFEPAMDESATPEHEPSDPAHGQPTYQSPMHEEGDHP